MRPSIILLAAAGAAMMLARTEPKKDHETAAPHQFQRGLPSDASYFPIAVWLQSPSMAGRYKEAGINLFVGLWRGPTDAQLSELKAAGMRVICAQNATGISHLEDPTIAGWMHDDEPDNAQPTRDPATGRQTYGPPVAPGRIVAGYERMRTMDPTRPVLLNLGQGVANDDWVGRGSSARPDDYLTYVKGCDIVSFDIYPVAGLPRADSEDFLWYVPKGIDRLIHWTNGEKRVWNCIECTAIGGDKKATPHQVRAEVWMSLIHGSKGLIYFVHQFKPRSDEHALLDDPEMLKEVTSINKQIHALAPVLNSPKIENRVTVKSEPTEVPIDVLFREFGGSKYLFAVGMRNRASRASFSLSKNSLSATAEVIGEERAIPVRNGRFADDFKPYDVHLYRIH